MLSIGKLCPQVCYVPESRSTVCGKISSTCSTSRYFKIFKDYISSWMYLSLQDQMGWTWECAKRAQHHWKAALYYIWRPWQFLITWKSQTSHIFKKGKKKDSGWSALPHPRDCYGAIPPGSHFQPNKRQKAYLKQPMWIWQNKLWRNCVWTTWFPSLMKWLSW